MTSQVDREYEYRQLLIELKELGERMNEVFEGLEEQCSRTRELLAQVAEILDESK